MLAFAVILSIVCVVSIISFGAGPGLWLTVVAMALLVVTSAGSLIVIRKARRAESGSNES
jgi:hypothetical protein